jgi:hypothetical protein
MTPISVRIRRTTAHPTVKLLLEWPDPNSPGKALCGNCGDLLTTVSPNERLVHIFARALLQHICPTKRGVTIIIEDHEPGA